MLRDSRRWMKRMSWWFLISGSFSPRNDDGVAAAASEETQQLRVSRQLSARAMAFHKVIKVQKIIPDLLTNAPTPRTLSPVCLLLLLSCLVVSCLFYLRQPISGGPLEQYICLLEDRVSSAETRMEEMRREHQAEVRDLEDEFEVRFACTR